jgi:hypothetical protein
MSLHIINHHYHLKKIKDIEAKIIVIGNFYIDDKRIVDQYPLYESCNLVSRLFSNNLNLIIKKINKTCSRDETIYFWGLQDKLSFRLAKQLIFYYKLRAVPDNIEFFLRYNSRGIKPLRAFLKSLMYLEGINFLSGKIGAWCGGRFVYPLPNGISIDHDKGFYSFIDSTNIPAKTDGITFISQPYNIDYGISSQDWMMIIEEILKELKLKFIHVNVKFHQRDTQEFINYVVGLGFDQTENTKSRVAGFFSTLLFEKALNGHETYILVDKLRGYIPNEYFGFSDWIITHLLKDFDQAKPINIKADAFNSLPIYLG